VTPDDLQQAILDAIDDGLVIADAGGRITGVNRRALALAGYGGDDWRGLTLADVVVSASEQLPIPLDLRSAAMGEEPGPLPAALRHKRGTTIPVEIDVRLLPANGLLIVVRENDTRTERRAPQDGIDTFDHPVRAQKMESIRHLAGRVAHEFNNVLNVIGGYAELAAGQVDGASSLQGPLREIQRASARAADVTRQLLAFARRQPAQPTTVDLNLVVEAALDRLRCLVGGKVRLVWSPGGPLWTVRIDPSQVEEVLVKLVVNAREAIAHAGQIDLRSRNIAVERADGARSPGLVPGEYAMLEVADDGRGMDSETKARIFEPFYTTKAEGQGTGLGLATVYGIVKQNHGYIAVESEVGQGATFRVLLPRIAETQPSPGQRTS
jgi:PAS domain S-box-containing protein